MLPRLRSASSSDSLYVRGAQVSLYLTDLVLPIEIKTPLAFKRETFRIVVRAEVPSVFNEQVTGSLSLRRPMQFFPYFSLFL